MTSQYTKMAGAARNIIQYLNFVHATNDGLERLMFEFQQHASPSAVLALLAERDAMKATLGEAHIWHEAQDKAISKQPNANTGHNGWMRAQHQEQAALIRAALAQEQEQS